jgi:hypothetical protein
MDAILPWLLGFAPGIGLSRSLPDADDAFRSSAAYFFYLLESIIHCLCDLKILSGCLSGFSDATLFAREAILRIVHYPSPVNLPQVMP